MGVIKNRLRKAVNSFQGLGDVDVFIQDTNPNSDYFNVYDLPEELTLGASSFLIAGSSLLKGNIELKIELIDSSGNVIFTTPIDNYLEGLSRRVSIEVYDNTSPGVATLHILGELDPKKTQVPTNFQNVYNVRWSKNININTTKPNTREILFYGQPTISVTEVPKGLIDRSDVGGSLKESTVNATVNIDVTPEVVFDSEPNDQEDFGEDPITRGDVGFDEDIKSKKPSTKADVSRNIRGSKKKGLGKGKGGGGSQTSEFDLTANIIAVDAGVNNSANKLTSDFIGATITITNPHTLVNTTKYPTSKYTLPTTYSTKISDVVNEKTFKLQNPYYITDNRNRRIPVSLKSSTNNASITYETFVEETNNTTYLRSFADITIGNLRTFSGDVFKSKIFVKDSNAASDYEEIYDGIIESPNILINENSATGFQNIGFFHTQSIIDNNWVSSSRVSGRTTGSFVTQNNSYIMDGALISGSVQPLDDYVEFRTAVSYSLENSVDYDISFDSYFIKGLKQYKEKSSDGSMFELKTEKRAELQVYLSGSGITGTDGEEDYFLGKIDIDDNENDEGFRSNVVGSFRSSKTGSPTSWLLFRLYAGQFVIKDVSFVPWSETNFNPNYFRTLIPMPAEKIIRKKDKFDFRAEFYDVNNNEAEVGAEVNNIVFNGVPTIVDGQDNKISGSMFIGDSVEMYGTNPAFIRSVGYKGFDNTISDGKGGFLLFSGSIGNGAVGGNRLTASEAYDGVGLEIVDAHASENRFLKFRTNPSTFQVVTNDFYFGQDRSIAGAQFISGSLGNIEISSSNFHLDNDGSVVMQGTITAEAGGTIGGFSLGGSSMFSGTQPTPTFFLSGSGHSGTNFEKLNLFISSSGFQVNAQGAISSSVGRIGGWTISDNLLTSDGGGIRLNSNGNNSEISINSHTFGNEGIQLGFNSGNPRFYAGDGSNNFLRYDTSNGVEIKTAKFLLDTDRLDINSDDSRISVFDDASSPKERIRIGEVDGGSVFGMKIFDGTGTADSDILVEFGEGGNKIAGWTISDSKISSNNLNLNSAGIVETSTYVSGLKGFRLSSEGNGFLEVENAKIRGTLRTTVFEKESVNAVGGQLQVGNATVITGSSTILADATTIPVENVSGFTGSEIIMAKKIGNTGFSTEYMLITSQSRRDSSSNTDFSGSLFVTRGYSGSNPIANMLSGSIGDTGTAGTTLEPGQVLVSTGFYNEATNVGSGYIRMNANPNDPATPYIDIVERTGSKIYEVDLKARLGDLSGLSSALVGSSPGFGLFSENVFLTGKITATSGEIGGWTIHSDKIFTGTDEDTANYTSGAGRLILSSSGALHAKEFYIDKDGNAAFKGDISAATGTIGNSIQIGSGENVFKADSNGIYLGNETFSSAEFRVTPAGAVTATNATLTGAITATSGDIAGWNINGNRLDSTNDRVILDGNNNNGEIRLGNTPPTSVGYTSNAGIYMNGAGDFLARADGDNYIKLDSDATPKLEIKSNAFVLDTVSSNVGIKMDSSNSTIITQSGSNDTAVRMTANTDTNIAAFEVSQSGLPLLKAGGLERHIFSITQNMEMSSIPLEEEELLTYDPGDASAQSSANTSVGQVLQSVDDINSLSEVNETFVGSVLEGSTAVGVPTVRAATMVVNSHFSASNFNAGGAIWLKNTKNSSTKNTKSRIYLEDHAASGSTKAIPVGVDVRKYYADGNFANTDFIHQTAAWSSLHSSADADARFVPHGDITGSAIYNFQEVLQETANDKWADGKFCLMRLDVDTSDLYKLEHRKEFVFLEARESTGSGADNTASTLRPKSRVFQVQASGSVVANGNITAFGSTFMNVSDKRLKRDVHTISESIDRVLELRPTEFVWKDNNKQDVGFIAQEVEELLPEVVETSKGFIDTDGEQENEIKDMKTISYPKLIPYLVDTIQVMDKRIKELEKKVK